MEIYLFLTSRDNTILVGYYIVEFEQKGKNRAEYGKNLLRAIADELKIKGLDCTHLNLCRIFYIKYPQICAAVSHKLKGIGVTQYIPDEKNFDISPETLIT